MIIEYKIIHEQTRMVKIIIPALTNMSICNWVFETTLLLIRKPYMAPSVRDLSNSHQYHCWFLKLYRRIRSQSGWICTLSKILQIYYFTEMFCLHQSFSVHCEINSCKLQKAHSLHISQTLGQAMCMNIVVCFLSHHSHFPCGIQHKVVHIKMFQTKQYTNAERPTTMYISYMSPEQAKQDWHQDTLEAAGYKGQWIKKLTKVMESGLQEVHRSMEIHWLVLNSLNRQHPLASA